MKKFIVFIIFIGLLVGGYFLLKKDNKGEPRCADGFRFVPSTSKCEPVQEVKSGEIDFTKIEIQVPGITGTIKLQKQGETTRYTGVSQIEVGKGSDTTQSRVSVSLDMKELSTYSEGLVLVPFLFESGGSGQFTYIGLFDVNQNKHLDSVIIGDRILVTSISVVQEKIKINFKDRLFTEAFAAAPSIPTQAVFQLKDNKLVQIMKLQNADYSDVEIKSPLVGVPISDTLQIKGAIPGTWYFEATAQFKIVDESYNEIAIGTVQALSDWMTTQRVPFEVTLPTTNLNYTGKATIIIQSENIQGEEEGEKLVKRMFIPIEL